MFSFNGKFLGKVSIDDISSWNAHDVNKQLWVTFKEEKEEYLMVKEKRIPNFASFIDEIKPLFSIPKIGTNVILLSHSFVKKENDKDWVNENIIARKYATRYIIYNITKDKLISLKGVNGMSEISKIPDKEIQYSITFLALFQCKNIRVDNMYKASNGKLIILDHNLFDIRLPIYKCIYGKDKNKYLDKVSLNTILKNMLTCKKIEIYNKLLTVAEKTNEELFDLINVSIDTIFNILNR